MLPIHAAPSLAMIFVGLWLTTFICLGLGIVAHRLLGHFGLHD